MPFVKKKENQFLSQSCTLKVPVAVGRSRVLSPAAFGAFEHRLTS